MAIAYLSCFCSAKSGKSFTTSLPCCKGCIALALSVRCRNMPRLAFMVHVNLQAKSQHTSRLEWRRSSCRIEFPPKKRSGAFPMILPLLHTHPPCGGVERAMLPQIPAYPRGTPHCLQNKAMHKLLCFSKGYNYSIGEGHAQNIVLNKNHVGSPPAGIGAC